jgi:hypothetical protein
MSTIGSLTAPFVGLKTRTRPARSATQISCRPARVAIAIGAFIAATRRNCTLMFSSGVGGAGAVVGGAVVGAAVVGVGAVVELAAALDVVGTAVDDDVALVVDSLDVRAVEPSSSLQAPSSTDVTTSSTTTVSRRGRA